MEQQIGYGDWDSLYRVQRCLKKTPERETCLLERRTDGARFVLKRGRGEQAILLEKEYEFLRGQAEFGTVEFQKNSEEGCLLRDYVEGATLGELIEREGPLDACETARLGIRIRRKAAVFHHQTPPVIHRDLKPENIVVTGTGRIRLIDFESARQYKPGQETDTVRLGTRGYAAPEQFGYGQTDQRTDIYALGKVLLYMAAGSCDGEDMPLLQTKEQKHLKKVIERCCAYDPAGRYADVEHLEKDLQRIARDQGRTWDAGRVCIALLLGVFCLLAVRLGLENHRLRLELAAQSEAVEPVDWNPYTYQEDVDAIVDRMWAEDYGGLAEHCEELVRKLSENEVLSPVKTIDTQGLEGEELSAYQSSREGYEFVADCLAYADGLPLNRLGSYADCAKEIARRIRRDIEYSWTEEDGTVRHGELYIYTVEGDERNMDGCLISILSCLNWALEQNLP